MIINCIFEILLMIFELTNPSFMFNIAKPLFTITFSVSLPIKMPVILLIMISSAITFLI